jgi:hypothetical protein
MKKFLILVLSTFSLLPSDAGAQSERRKVFILAGQSNMEGQGSVDHDAEVANGGKGLNLFWPPHEFFGKLVFHTVHRDHTGQICCNLKNLRLGLLKV